MGRIVKRRAPYNARWSYHLAPDTINFFHYAVEVCDATIPYAEEHVDEVGGAFLPGGHWCPGHPAWSARWPRQRDSAHEPCRRARGQGRPHRPRRPPHRPRRPIGPRARGAAAAGAERGEPPAQDSSWTTR